MHKSKVNALNNLQYLHNIRYVAAMQGLLKAYQGTFSYLKGEDKVVFDRLVGDMREWASIEEEHGAGAMLNIEDETARRYFSSPRSYARVPEYLYKNAVKYQGNSVVIAAE